MRQKVNRGTEGGREGQDVDRIGGEGGEHARGWEGGRERERERTVRREGGGNV